MGGKSDIKSQQHAPAEEGLSRRAKKKANDLQRQKTFEAHANGVEGVLSSKRYQSSRSQSAQKRDRNRKAVEAGDDAARARTALADVQVNNLPEDMRISKLLRRLASEKSASACLDLCDRLELVILDQQNASYVRKSFDILSNTIMALLDAEPRECRDRVAQLLGMMLFVLTRGSADQSVFRLWTAKWLRQGKRLRRPILIALRQTLLLDRDTEDLYLRPAIGGLVVELQELLEQSDSADVFVLVTDIMVGLACAYPECFASHFSDVVDIVVGWQLETMQRSRLKLHCARVLLAFQPYWHELRDVTLNLLDQFIEDIEGCWEDLEENDHEQCLAAHRLSAALLTSFNSVIKCLNIAPICAEGGKRAPLGGGFDLEPDDRELFQSGCISIMTIVSVLIEEPLSDLAFSAICEFIMLCLTLNGHSCAQADIPNIIEGLLWGAHEYSDTQLGSLLHLLIRYVDTDTSEQKAHTMALLKPTMTAGATGFYTVRFRRSKAVQRALLLLYHRLLTIKNVALLQMCYGLLLDDFDDALALLRRYANARTGEGNVHLQVQYRISFNLLILSPLAMARNSIFITWTLQDRPVLHTLLERLALLDAKLWACYGQLQHAIVLVAYHHCVANNNFVSSSNLLRAKSYGGTVDRFLRLDRTAPGEERQSGTAGSGGERSSTASIPNASPTADHFGQVLRFLCAIFSEWNGMDTLAADGVGCGARGPDGAGSSPRNELLVLLLDWCHEIVKQTERFHDVLLECVEFNRLLTLVCTISVDCGSANERIGLRCANTLDAVCQYALLHPVVYQAIAEACCVHLCSVYGSLRTKYTVIFSRLPLRHSLRQVNAFTGVNRRRREEIRELKNALYQSTSTELRHQQSAVLRMADLRALLNRIAFARDDTAYVGEYLHELLTRSYNQPSAYGEMALRDLRCLIPWVQWEAAQLCVNHKLRTPFGKPQSTFLRIESIVKQCARILALNDRFRVHDIRTSIANQRHARILLGFLEALEKAIYNAAEGTAYALPAPEKPARTFFRVNAPTCAEWFTRIRTAVDLVALHCMEPEMVIRYSEAVLRELVVAGKTADLIFEHMLMSLVWALVRNWESDALYGVYVWSKQLTGRKYSWIRMAAEEAAGHRETAAEGFRAILADPAGAGMDRHIRDFIVDQTIISLLFTGDYRQLYEFLLAEETGGTPRATIPLITITAEQIRSIIRYEETHDASVIDISQWELVELGNDIPNDFSCHKMICAVENSLSGIILQEQIEQRERMIEASTELIQCYLQECLLTKCREYLFQLTITNHMLYKIAQRARTAAATAAAATTGSRVSPGFAYEAAKEGGQTMAHGRRQDDGIGSLSVEKFYGTLTLMRLLAWSEFLASNSDVGAGGGSVERGSAGGYEGAQQNIDLRLDMVSIGRKEKNYALCRRELEKYYHKSNLAQRLGSLLPMPGKPTLEQIAAALISSIEQPDSVGAGAGAGGSLWVDENLPRAVYEHCKWLYCQPGKRLEAIDFAAHAATAIDGAVAGGSPSTVVGSGLAERTARFMLTLGNWLSGAGATVGGPEPCELSLTALQLASVRRLGKRLPAIEAKPLALDHAAWLGASDLLVGSLLQGAAGRCPMLAKAWFKLGSWLYRWGKRMVELSSGVSSTRISVEQVAAILVGSAGVTMADCERIVAIMNEHEPGRAGEGEREGTTGADDGTEDGEIELDSSATIGSIGLVEALQRALPALGQLVPPEQLHAIVEVWRSNHRAVYGYYEAAAAAYFRFLQLSTVLPRSTGPDDDGFDSERARSVTVTLRLLRLIVKHALGLKEVLEEGLATTPSEPWRVITPQLFSRLAHHEPYVRRRVSELLCRVAKDAPHLIIFPAVVGSVHEEQPELANVVNVLLDGAECSEFACEGNAAAAAASTAASTAASAAALAAGGPASGLASCFNALLDILSREVPDTVKQVQTLVHELRRISLLWEELWVVSLQQIHADYAKRVAAFEGEYARLHGTGQLTEARRALLAEKHRLLLRPLIFVLEQLHAITARPAETPHERQFQDRYHRYIRSMLEKLRAPADFSRPIEGWERFQALYTQLHARSQKRFAFVLRLADVSPNLLQLAHTAIAMPGIDTTTVTTAGRGGGPEGAQPSPGGGTGCGIVPVVRHQPILIRAVDGGIQILPTKTRPKKLVFHGNDGRRYGYLSKGLEDLHLDERIMQFLSIANLMMTRSIDCNGNVTHYRAEHYSVIPLGPRSGLITWVDNTVPIFSLYKKWQQREALQRKESKEGGGAVLQPSALFYQKLNPLLQSHGMKSSDSRREWPLAALKQVLAELQQETPRDLLAKELWCHSATASSWRQVVRTYSLSLAVMSVIGYIIGLGDRHLDNVLVKLATGEIVHIDYNVCFEKGKTLRVPEKVPFRMTPNLEEALGMTGIEGTFRLACEHVLKSLKKGRETLLTLLEAFVYDPLVDWAISEEAGGGLPMTSTDITMSTMKAATGPKAAVAATLAAASTLATTPAGTSVASKYISQAKKQLDREVTRDTLAVRFAECRADWQQNRDDLLQHLLGAQKLLEDQRAVRDGLHEAEQLRSSLSRQLQLIGEAEYLDTAFGSHSLSTLAHRLDVRAHMQEAYGVVRSQLAHQADQLHDRLADYDACRASFRTDRLWRLRQDTCHTRWKAVEFPPGLVAFFVAHKSAEDTSYTRFCSARKKLTEHQLRVAPAVESIAQLLVQYGGLIELMDADDAGDGKSPVRGMLARYADWYTRLARPEKDPCVANEELQRVLLERKDVAQSLSSTDQSIGRERDEMNMNGMTPWYYLSAKRIVELSHSLLATERELLAAGAQEKTEQCETELVERLFQQVRTIRQQGEQLALASSTYGKAPAGLYKLLRAAEDYEAVKHFYESLLQAPNSHDTGGAVDPPVAGLEDLLERTIDKPLAQGTTVHELVDDWTYSLKQLSLEFGGCATAAGQVDHDHETSDPQDQSGSKLTIIDMFRKAIPKQDRAILRALMADIGEGGEPRQRRRTVHAVCWRVFHRFCTRLKGLLPKATAALVLETSPSPPTAGAPEQLCLAESCSAILENDGADGLESAAARRNTSLPLLDGAAEQQQQGRNPYEAVGRVARSAWEADAECAGGRMPRKSAFLQQLRGAIDTLNAVRPLMKSTQEKLFGCAEVLRNRLAWATAAHPPLCPPELLRSFERMTAANVERTNRCMQVCEQAWRYGTAVLQLEEERFYRADSPVAQKFDQLIDRWQKMLINYGRMRTTFVTPTEEALVELLDPEGSIDHTWISNVRALIDDMTDQALTKIAQLEQDSTSVREALQASGRKLHTLTVAHNAIAGDIRALLRTQLRIGGSQELRDYLQRYKRFLELLAEVRDGLSGGKQRARPKEQQQQQPPAPDSTTATPVDQQSVAAAPSGGAAGTGDMLAKVNELLALLPDVFERLFTFERLDDGHSLGVSAASAADDGLATSDGSTTTISSSMHRATDSPTADVQQQDRNQRQKEQKRNAYAVSVWRRIRMKLEGRDPDPGRRYSVPEQVSWMIQEAMDPNNLAVLYEGWTPWV